MNVEFMKTGLLVLALVLASTLCRAQVVVEGGYNMTKLTGSMYRFLPGFYLGAGYDMKVNDCFYISPKLLFASNGTITNLGNDVKTTSHVYMLELPILASFRMNVSEVGKIHFNVGPYIGLGLFGKSKVKQDGKTIMSGNTLQHGDKRFDYGFRFGVAYEQNNFIYSLNFKQSITDDDLWNSKSLGLSAGVGYRF